MKLFQPVGLITSIFALSSLATPITDEAKSTTDLQYEYIVVGSGAGGGPLACRLAMAGHSTLLIESGNDQGGNINISVPAYQGVVTNDPKIRWDMFVNHYQDQTRAQRDPKYTWQVGPYKYHVGPNPPSGATPLGILYPRAGTLGGCVTHNALIWITPHASDWNNIATLTGDNTWAASNMNQYLDKVYQWLPTGPVSPTILLNDLKLTQHLAGAAEVMGQAPGLIGTVLALTGTLAVDPNDRTNPNRDSTQGLFQIPLTQSSGKRTSVRDFISRTVAQGYPLTVRQNCHVTKVLFDSSSPPKATGVSFLDGNNLFRASPLSGATGTPGSARVTKEVIISAGTYNTPQLLKLSGIGPAIELARFGIPVISNLPGVGTNLQDRYEIPVTVKHGMDFNILTGCTFDGKAHDTCLQTWEANPSILSLRGTYASNGVAASMVQHSNYADNSDVDLFIFGGPFNFNGYFPGWNDDIVKDHKSFVFCALKAHTRNHAGTVALRSADPLDPVVVNFNYFDTGTTDNGADLKDLHALVQAVNQSRLAFQKYNNYWILGGDGFTELAPGAAVQSEADIEQYIKDRAWGHHASCSCPIGADSDPMAVLDSKFRVRGVQNLRVVDASAFPKIPGIFIQAPIMIMSEKAADVILYG